MELIEKMAAAIGDADPAESSSQYLAQAALTALIEHAGGDGVTEGDRDAAKSLLGRDDAGPSWWSIDSGNADNDRLVQAFARHRATAFAAGRAARDREIEEQQGAIKRLLTANRVLRQGLHGLMDSEDASEIATLLATGQSVDWDAYPEATKRAVLWSDDDE